MGYLTRGVSPQHPEMRAMLHLMQAGRAWAKISGPYRVSLHDAPYEPVADIVRWLADGCAQQLVWGSDWPHVMVRGAMPHDADLLDLLGNWVPEAQRRESILVDNPARLYGWA
jgi:predicted TIM-barrel fold metal-dependent hydrolase